MALRVCSTAGCPELTDGGRCFQCRGDAEKRRGTASQRGYGKQHRGRFRPAVLARNPICVICRKRPSTVADHYPHSRRDLERLQLDPNDPTHGRGLCADCHNYETSQHQPGGWHDAQ